MSMLDNNRKVTSKKNKKHLFHGRLSFIILCARPVDET